MTPVHRVSVLGLICLVAVVAIAGLRHVPDRAPLQAAEDLLLDLRFRLRGPRPPSDAVLIVSIEDGDLARHGLMAPLRTALADAIARLLDDGAAAVAVDLLLVEPTDADLKLASALASHPGAVLAVAASDGAGPPLTDRQRHALAASAFAVVASPGGDPPGPSGTLLAPTDALATAAALGHVNVARATDRVARRVPLAVDLPDGGALPSLALVAARQALNEPQGALSLWRGAAVTLGERTILTNGAGQMTLNHYGGPGNLETVTLSDLLDGQVSPDLIADRAVFIGAGADSLGDVFATPFAADVSGVEVLATLAANLIADDSIDSGAPIASTGLALAGAVLVGAAVAVPSSPVLAAAATLGAALAVAAALQAAFLGGVALDAVTVLGALAVASALHWALRLRVDRARTLRIDAERRRATGFLSPFATATLDSDSLEPEWRSEPAAVGFIDVEGSVGLAEHSSPEDVAALLASVQGVIARAAERHGGAVVERFGDGALVVFGFGSAGGPAEALAFARDLIRTDTKGPRMRASLHYGPAALANLGGGVGGHITVAGDTVNVAARLQETAKRAGAAAVASRALLDAAGVDLTAAGLAALPLQQLRGRSEGVEVWALLR